MKVISFYKKVQENANLDLKSLPFQPENLLYADTTDSCPLKIADFGLSKMLLGDFGTSTVCGTPGYCGTLLRLESY